MNKPILYIDMDGVIADFGGGVKKHNHLIDVNDFPNSKEYVDAICEANPDIFHNLDPLPDAIDAVNCLFDHFDVYFLSTPMWNVPESFTGKRIWIEKHFGELATKRLILTHRKDLCIGDYLIDDRTSNGAGEFKGEHIHFGTEAFSTWQVVVDYLCFKLENNNNTDKIAFIYNTVFDSITKNPSRWAKDGHGNLSLNTEKLKVVFSWFYYNDGSKVIGVNLMDSNWRTINYYVIPDNEYPDTFNKFTTLYQSVLLTVNQSSKQIIE